MDFSTSIKTCFSKYATFSGRASRSEYWFFVLFTLLVTLVLYAIEVMLWIKYDYCLDGDLTRFLDIDSYLNCYLDADFDFPLITYIVGFLNFSFGMVSIIPSLAVHCRRLHDVNRSGWWYLLYLTIIGGIVLLVWLITQGEKNKNRFGPPINFKN